MTEVIGDVIIPSELIVPSVSTTITEQPLKSGALYISGSKMYFHMGTPQLITSA